jgi:hypothetical protein
MRNLDKKLRKEAKLDPNLKYCAKYLNVKASN